MIRRGFVTPAFVVLALLASSCSSSGSETSTTTSPPVITAPTTTAPTTTTAAPTTMVAPTTTEAPGQVTSLPPCGPDAAIPAAVATGQIGFIKDGTAYVTDPSGGSVACVTDNSAGGALVWGPTADRVVAGRTVLSASGSARVLTTVTPTWSRPTGTSLIWVDDGRLLKAGIDESQARDLTFLDRHDAVTYHPAGVEIATTGEGSDGTRGVWLASNEGANPRLLVLSEEATVHEFTFTHDGLSAYFLADHGDGWHVHDISVVVADTGTNEFNATIRLESAGPLSHLVVSPWDGLWAVQEAACGSGSHIVIDSGEAPAELGGFDTTPVGWLPGRRLVVAAYPNGCDASADLWVVDVAIGAASTATLLVTGVDEPAIRAALPEPPPPIGDVSLDEFA